MCVFSSFIQNSLTKLAGVSCVTPCRIVNGWCVAMGRSNSHTVRFCFILFLNSGTLVPWWKKSTWPVADTGSHRSHRLPTFKTDE